MRLILEEILREEKNVERQDRTPTETMPVWYLTTMPSVIKDKRFTFIKHKQLLNEKVRKTN